MSATLELLQLEGIRLSADNLLVDMPEFMIYTRADLWDASDTAEYPWRAKNPGRTSRHG
jgi:hypothetical protein